MSSQTNPRVTVADFIADRLAETDKTQRQVAQECGFEKPNIITMFKNGSTKLPLNRIGRLAKALDVEPAYLLRLAMQEYMPDTWEAIEDVMQSTVLTSNEIDLIRAYRRATGDSDAVTSIVDNGHVIAIMVADDCQKPS